MFTTEQTEIPQAPVQQYLDKCQNFLSELKGDSAKENVDPQDLMSLTRDYKDNFDLMMRELSKDERFTETYCTRLSHDAKPDLIGFIQMFIRKNDYKNPVYTTLIDGINHILGSVQAEFEFKTEEVNIKQLVDDVLMFLDAYWVVTGKNVPPVNTFSFIDHNQLKLDHDIKVTTHYDTAFRVILNLVSNGAKAARIKMKNPGMEGGWVNVQTSEDKDGEVKVLVEDNGPGLAEYLKAMGVDTADYKNIIPLGDILKASDSVSLFAKASNEGGTGNGLQIVEHLAELGNINVDIKKSFPGAGGQVIVTFPSSGSN